MDRKTYVVALGGNALGSTPKEQRRLVEDTAAALVDIAEHGDKLVVAHGNGPQVGMIYSAFAEASKHDANIPNMPFAEAGAMSQGYIGYHLAQAIDAECAKRKLDTRAVAVITQVEVAADDEAFNTPTKPVGPFLTEEEAKTAQETLNGTYAEDAGRGWRLVVASPAPQRIIELDEVRTLADAGFIVVCCGGGGVPVVKEDGQLEGVPAVIDKDRTSALLAKSLDADALVILTAVDKVALDFNKETQRDIDEMTIDEACTWEAQGQFAKGSMLPKIQACVSFVENTGKSAIIASLLQAGEAISGNAGTKIIP